MCLSVCVLGIQISPAKTDKPIQSFDRRHCEFFTSRNQPLETTAAAADITTPRCCLSASPPLHCFLLSSSHWDSASRIAATHAKRKSVITTECVVDVAAGSVGGRSAVDLIVSQRCQCNTLSHTEYYVKVHQSTAALQISTLHVYKISANSIQLARRSAVASGYSALGRKGTTFLHLWLFANSIPCASKFVQEAQISPRDSAMRRVSWNLANCHATV